MSHPLTPGTCVCRTLCKHGANPGLWGRSAAGDVGNLAERHSKSEAVTTQLAHVYKSYQARPSTRFSLSAMSESWPGIATSNSDRDYYCALLLSPHQPLHLTELKGRVQDRRANRKSLKATEDMRCV